MVAPSKLDAVDQDARGRGRDRPDSAHPDSARPDSAHPDSARPSDELRGAGRFRWSPTGRIRWPGLVVVLVVVYAATALLVRPGGYLSTDVGGKTASVAAMAADGGTDPDIGYWFADRDPDGRFHPYANTTRTADGQWLNTTSLTMVLPAGPVWSLGERSGIGGERAILVFPFAGAVAAALAAGALERRIRALAGRPPTGGHRSVLVVGLATPVAVYALDFWEHSLGLAGMLAGLVLTLEAIGRREEHPVGAGPWRATSEGRRALAAAGAGLAFGLAGTMRQEAMVYGMVAGLALGATLVARRSPLAAAVRGLMMVAGFVAMIGAHAAVEVAVTGGSFRGGRAAGTAGGAGAGLIERLHTGVITLLFPLNGEHPLSYALGIGLVVALAWWAATRMAGGNDRLPVSGVRAVALCVGVVWLAFGPRFVPGLVPTTPLAVIGAVALFRGRHVLIAVLALVPVPLVLAVQFTEGAYVQWGGRYLLTTGATLAVAAVALVADDHRRMVALVAVAGLLTTAYGVAWRIQRAERVGDDWVTLAEASSAASIVATGDIVVVFLDGHHAREAGPLFLDRRWLAAPEPDALPELIEALAAAGETSFLLVAPNMFELDVDDAPPAWAGNFVPTEQLGALDLFESELILFQLEHTF